MEKVVRKLSTLKEAVDTLHESIQLYNEYKTKFEQSRTKENELLFKALRDSVIQRFEYSTDLFWKMLKAYLESEKVAIESASPRGIIRQAVKAKTLTEKEGMQCIDMITNRNETSHIYHEEIAQDIVSNIPGFYTLLSTVIVRIDSKLKG